MFVLLTTFIMGGLLTFCGLPLKSRHVAKKAAQENLDADTIRATSYLAYNYSFIDFPFEDTASFSHVVTDYDDQFADGGRRWGYIVDGFKEGKWVRGVRRLDSLGNFVTIHVHREEYFKHGLRDSIFKIFDKDGQFVYSTYFKMGTGVLREYHDNGQLYYQVGTQAGYFTDTLRLYTEQGVLYEKLFYKKDSLVMHQRLRE
jgi:antitoxin component YwqK of YwqJK toxin-antitoxin module